MSRIADQLPPQIAQQIHPDRRKNEADYWAARDQLLKQYQGQWIGFADGQVIASGSSPVTVFHAAEASGRHPFFICVGREDEPCRIRRVSAPYDASYPGGKKKVSGTCQEPFFTLQTQQRFLAPLLHATRFCCDDRRLARGL